MWAVAAVRPVFDQADLPPALASSMAALVAAIHAFGTGAKRAWMPGTSPGTNAV